MRFFKSTSFYFHRVYFPLLYQKYDIKYTQGVTIYDSMGRWLAFHPVYTYRASIYKGGRLLWIVQTKGFLMILEIVGIVVTVISIIVTVISILITIKEHKNSNHSRQS